eukprot:4432825-Amphidinium_carterae.1
METRDGVLLTHSFYAVPDRELPRGAAILAVSAVADVGWKSPSSVEEACTNCLSNCAIHILILSR